MKALLCFILIACSWGAWSQVSPAEGSKLNYRWVGFRFEKKKNIASCEVKVAIGHYTKQDVFDSHVYQTFAATENRVAALLPAFGKEYTWQVKYLKDGSEVNKGELHHFAVEASVYTDTNLFRLRVIKPTDKYADGFIFNDASRVFYDMSGNPVWFLPDIPGRVDAHSTIRGLKMTSRNTLTFMCEEMPYEVDYNGHLLWQAPNNGKVNGDSAEHYHHEFTRLSNGHYMVLGDEHVHWMVPASDFGNSMLVFDASGKPMTTNAASNEKLEFATLIEYDEQGNVVWQWHSADYFKKTYEQKDRLKKEVLKSHANSFYFDEKSKNIYVGFKILGQILKVQYPGGDVLAVYGKTYYPNTQHINDGTFCEQHNSSLTSDGNLMLFNNNMCHLDVPPNIYVFEEPKVPGERLKTVLEYTYPEARTGLNRSTITQGGSIAELRDKDYLVSMCTPYGHSFIVSSQKEILWDAFTEKWNTVRKVWENNTPYRVTYIPNNKVLEDLIWAAKETRK